MILAGDIGGTKILLALFRRTTNRPTLIREEIFSSRGYKSLNQVIEAFLQGEKGSIRSACFGIAGPVFKGRCEATNLPWVVDTRQISRRLNIPFVMLLNDLEATAYGTLELTENECKILNRGRKGAGGNRAIIAAGTGLGEAILFRDGTRYRPAATEGGHSDFAPRNPTQIRLLEFLSKRFGRVSYERLLSGPGLFNIYQFLRETGAGEEPLRLSKRLAAEDPSAVITEAALTGKVPLCVKTLDLFVDVYGAEAGNLALKSLATGGVYIGGGIAPKILAKLFDGAFMRSFLDKGRFASFMSRIPVRVILNEKTALRGAARYALEERI